MAPPIGIKIGAGISIGNGISFAIPYITATAGATTSVVVQQNSAITSFNPFASVVNGRAPYTYYVSAGTLPPGITINSSTGLVSGTPTVIQSAASVTFSVQDVNNQVATTTSTVSFAVTAATYTIQYLAVGGGGGSGTSNTGYYEGAGGGGGGGFVCGSANILPGVSYTITVGAGGIGQVGVNPVSIQPTGGDNSSISGTGVSVTAVGGGYGAGWSRPPGGPGGSGGGGTNGTCTNGGVATGSPGQGVAGTQGYPGGNGFPTDTYYYAGAGGGGAGGVGSSITNCTQSGGAGGAGRAWPYTGVTYAGGGGGSSNAHGSGGGSGGSGGGGPGSGYPGAGTAGTPGLGGGAGGSIGNGQPGAAGGAGTVIIAVPTARYPTVSAPGAAVSTPGSAPGYTILTYTAANPTTPSTFTYTA